MLNIQKNLSILVDNLPNKWKTTKWIGAAETGNLITVSKWNLLGVIFYWMRGDFDKTRIQTAIASTFKEINATYDDKGTYAVHETKPKKAKKLTPSPNDDIGLGEDVGITAGEVALRVALLAPQFLPSNKEDLAEINLAIQHDEPFIQEQWITQFHKQYPSADNT